MADATTFVEGVFGEDDDRPLLRAIRMLSFLDLDRGPWVAGGAARHLLGCPNAPSDLDVFFDGDRDSPVDRGMAVGLMRGLTSSGGASSARTLNIGGVFTDFPSMDVSLVLYRGFEDVRALIEEIDFTVCRAATDGRRWIADARCVPDIQARRLVAVRTPGTDNRALRLCRYVAMGYVPVPGTISKTLGLHEIEVIRTKLDGRLRWQGTGTS